MTQIALQARAVQTTAFSPRLQHAVRLLQLSSLDYARALHEAAEANPPPADVQDAVDCIRRLNARPGWQYGESAARTVTPDVIVRKIRGAWTTVLNDTTLPRVHLHKSYASLFEKHRRSEHAEMTGCLERAKWTVQNPTQRATTIHHVAQEIVARQQLFLEYGALAMKPLGLREVADAVGVHPSTVSRTAPHKYMATPFGVFEFRSFFSRGMDHSGGGASAPGALKALIGELVAAEPGGSPLSDAELARQLAGQGFRIARRTVTKYRQGLHLAPVEQRRAARSNRFETQE